VATSADVIVVGARYEDELGAVHVFERDGDAFVHTARLEGRDLSGAAGFGAAFAVSEDRIVVGAPYGSEPAVHVFARQAGVWTAVASVSCPVERDRECPSIGSSVALSGVDLVVGVPGARSADDRGLSPGAIYVGTVP
jgi:hypothetical protein